MGDRIRILGLVLFFCFFMTNIQSQENKLLIRLKNGSSQQLGLKTIKNISFSLTNMLVWQTDWTHISYPNSTIQSMCFMTIVDDVPAVNENPYSFVYPNPTKGIINFRGLDDKSIALKLYNMNGMLVFNAKINSSVQSVNIDFLPRGIYLINVNGQQSKLIKL
jgi:hypothetical protein